jgi:hypothetical protein
MKRSLLASLEKQDNMASRTLVMGQILWSENKFDNLKQLCVDQPNQRLSIYCGEKMMDSHPIWVYQVGYKQMEIIGKAVAECVYSRIFDLLDFVPSEMIDDEINGFVIRLDDQFAVDGDLLLDPPEDVLYFVPWFNVLEKLCQGTIYFKNDTILWRNVLTNVINAISSKCSHSILRYAPSLCKSQCFVIKTESGVLNLMDLIVMLFDALGKVK